MSTTNMFAEDSNQQQFSQKISNRKYKTVGAIETAKAERQTTCAVNAKIDAEVDNELQIENFERDLCAMYNQEYINGWKKSDTIPESIRYNGRHVAEANSLTIKVYGEKQSLIANTYKYIQLQRKQRTQLKKEIENITETSADFEEQLENALNEQDQCDIEIKEKKNEINELYKVLQEQKNQQDKLVSIFLLIILYSFIFGSCGFFSTLNYHLQVIGYAFYSCGYVIQTTFVIGANTTELLLESGKQLYTFFS